MYDYPVAYSFPAAGAGVPADAAAGASVQLIPMIPMIPMPLVLLMMLPVPLDNAMCPCRRANTQVAWCTSPPGVLAWVGGGGMVSRASGTPIYILIYILSFISQIPVTYTWR